MGVLRKIFHSTRQLSSELVYVLNTSLLKEKLHSMKPEIWEKACVLFSIKNSYETPWFKSFY